jgi:glycerol-1-phosphate dehydrogenase [NAD(P)+]
MSRTLDRLLRGEYPDPRTGKPLAVPIRSIVVEPSLAGREAELVSALGLGRTLAVVSDPQTEQALGARVKKALAAGAHLVPVALPSRPHPDQATAEAIRQAGQEADAFVAVGSGTINDLCKYAAARAGKPYVVFATAPSMNGYTSKNASITVGGLKRTLPAAVPQGVFMDLGVLAAAPPRLIRAGVGDTLCRSTVQADWLLAHLLRGAGVRSEAPGPSRRRRSQRPPGFRLDVDARSYRPGHHAGGAHHRRAAPPGRAASPSRGGLGAGGLPPGGPARRRAAQPLHLPGPGAGRAH